MISRRRRRSFTSIRVSIRVIKERRNQLMCSPTIWMSSMTLTFTWMSPKWFSRYVWLILVSSDFFHPSCILAEYACYSTESHPRDSRSPYKYGDFCAREVCCYLFNGDSSCCCRCSSRSIWSHRQCYSDSVYLVQEKLLGQQDDADWPTVGVKEGQRLMMMGTADEIVKAPEKGTVFVEDLPEDEQVVAVFTQSNWKSYHE